MSNTPEYDLPAITCPQCGGPSTFAKSNRFRPFCSERCKLIDLGAWAAEEHSIPGDPIDDELFSSDLPQRH